LRTACIYYSKALKQNQAVWQDTQNMSTLYRATALYICTRKVLGTPFLIKEITMKQLIAIIASVAALSAFAAEPQKAAVAATPAAVASAPAVKKEAPKADTKSTPAKVEKAPASAPAKTEAKPAVK
jgi:hypothetical protein